MGGFRGSPGAVLATVVVGVFMAIVDVSIVNVAIPDIIADLDASLAESLWVINSYALVGAALVITTGRLGDLIGLRRMFAAGVVVFTASSLACGLVSSPEPLVAARVAQGWVPRCSCRRRSRW